MPLNEALPPDIEQRLAGLGHAIAAASADVDFAYVFGSVAAGRQTPRSDVDLAIHVTDHSDGRTVRLEVARAASRHLGTDAVDVVLLNVAPIALAGRVLTTRRVVLDRVPFARHRYESQTARLFQDFRIREHRLLTQRYPRG
jgi:predicted nucleotidyltransferase